MNKLRVGISLFTLFLSINFSPSLAQKVLGPRMVMTEKTFELAQVYEGKIIEHSFKVLNVGDRPLKIEKVKPR